MLTVGGLRLDVLGAALILALATLLPIIARRQMEEK